MSVCLFLLISLFFFFCLSTFKLLNGIEKERNLYRFKAKNRMEEAKVSIGSETKNFDPCMHRNIVELRCNDHSSEVHLDLLLFTAKIKKPTSSFFIFSFLPQSFLFFFFFCNFFSSLNKTGGLLGDDTAREKLMLNNNVFRVLQMFICIYGPGFDPADHF